MKSDARTTIIRRAARLETPAQPVLPPRFTHGASPPPFIDFELVLIVAMFLSAGVMFLLAGRP